MGAGGKRKRAAAAAEASAEVGEAALLSCEAQKLLETLPERCAREARLRSAGLCSRPRSRQAKALLLAEAAAAESTPETRVALQAALLKRLRKWAAAAATPPSAAAVPPSPSAASLPLLRALPGGPRLAVLDGADPEERARRASREERFAGDELGVPGGPALRLAGLGTSTCLEKPFLRLTAPPHASTVRPPRVLRLALAHVKRRWREAPDYAGWACEQLKSLRQDLTVQRVRDSLAVEVYETHARVALEVGDAAEYGQCASVLRVLHPANPGAGCPPEFAAYRLLSAARTGREAFADELRGLSPSELAHPCVQHARAVAAAARTANGCSFFRLYRSAPRMSPYLMDALAQGVRAAALAAALAAYRPGAPLEHLAAQLGFADAAQMEGWAQGQGAVAVSDQQGGATLLCPPGRAPSLLSPPPPPPPKRDKKQKKHRRLG